MSKRTVVVVNGTADEGYWVVNYLLQLGQFNVKATVRRAQSAKAQRLRDLDHDGNRCQLVQAATDDRDALAQAFQGAHAIYGTSIYNIYAKRYRAANPEEMAQGRAVIQAAKACTTLEHFVWQTMTRFDIPPEELGLDAPIHFRTKWRLEQDIINAELPWTFLRQPAYLRQLAFGMQYKNRLVYPYAADARLSFVAEEDIGKIAAAIFANPQSTLGHAINAVSEVVTPTKIAERVNRIDPSFKCEYRQASWLENAFFDYIIVGLKPAYRYPLQINRNIMAGNYFAITNDDKTICEQLVAPAKLTTLEDWYRTERL